MERKHGAHPHAHHGKDGHTPKSNVHRRDHHHNGKLVDGGSSGAKQRTGPHRGMKGGPPA